MKIVEIFTKILDLISILFMHLDHFVDDWVSNNNIRQIHGIQSEHYP